MFDWDEEQTDATHFPVSEAVVNQPGQKLTLQLKKCNLCIVTFWF